MVLERLNAVDRMQRELGQVYDRDCVGHFGVGRETMQSSRQAGPARHSTLIPGCGAPPAQRILLLHRSSVDLHLLSRRLDILHPAHHNG